MLKRREVISSTLAAVALGTSVFGAAKKENPKCFLDISIGGKRVRFEIAADDDAADPKQGTAAAQHRALVPQLTNLSKLYQVLAKSRAKRGAIDFETIETQMIFDAHGRLNHRDAWHPPP